MAGMFELFLDDDATFRFQLTAPDGTVMAVSRAFSDKEEAVRGIAAVREYAGMGLVREISASPVDRPSPPVATPPSRGPPCSAPPGRRERGCSRGRLAAHSPAAH